MMKTGQGKGFLLTAAVCLLLCAVIGLWSAEAKADYGWTNTSMNEKMVDFTYELTFDEAGNPIVSIDYPFKETGANAAMAGYKGENDEYFEMNFVYSSGTLKPDPEDQKDKETFSKNCRAIQEGKASLQYVKVGKVNPRGGEGWGWEIDDSQRATFEYSDIYRGFNSLAMGETRYSISYVSGNITQSEALIVGNGAFLQFEYDEKGQLYAGYCNTPNGEASYDAATGLFDGKPVTDFGFKASVLNTLAPAAVGESAKAEGNSREQTETQTAGDAHEEPAKSAEAIYLQELIDTASDTEYVYSDGFGIPVFAGENRESNKIGYKKTEKIVGDQTKASGVLITTFAETANGFVKLIKQTVGHSVEPWDDFLENSSDAEVRYDMVRGMLTSLSSIEKSEMIEIDGHPASLTLYSNPKMNGMTTGYILYFRNNAALMTIITQTSPVTMDDLKLYASYIKYDESQAPITQAAGQLELSADKSPHFLPAGKKLKIKATFADEKLIKKQMPSECVRLMPMKFEGEGWSGTIPVEGGYILLSMSKGSPTTLAWYIADAETGETVKEGVSVDDKGTVTVDKDLKETRNVIIKAESGLFHSEAGYELTVVPAAEKIAVEPAEVVFYDGTSEVQTLQAVLSPDTFRPTGIQWTAAKKGIVELSPGEGGSATVKPIAAGKTTLTATEPSGKKATVKVSVVTPVSDLELKTKGKPVPGGTVTVTGTVAPKNAGNKELEWSLDVGEDIATCVKGTVKISKNTPAGTVITVTCKATGAPEPIEKTIQIEVLEK